MIWCEYHLKLELQPIYNPTNTIPTARSVNSVRYEMAVIQPCREVLRRSRTKMCCKYFWTSNNFQNIRCAHSMPERTYTILSLRCSTNKIYFGWFIVKHALFAKKYEIYQSNAVFTFHYQSHITTNENPAHIIYQHTAFRNFFLGVLFAYCSKNTHYFPALLYFYSYFVQTTIYIAYSAGGVILLYSCLL